MLRRGGELCRQSTTVFLWGGGVGRRSYLLAFVEMYSFLQVMVILKTRKNAVCSNGICWNEKKFLFSEEGSQEKMSYVSAMLAVLTDKLTLQVVVLARS